MRPLKLEMHHFGPFLEETIDFEGIDQELFLITGPTGSGKTTIFDGMCYALYGEGSNTFRQAKEMKSQFGDPLDMMWVEFTFRLRNRVYRIRRIPEQERRRTRGEGSASQKHEVFLYEQWGDEEKLISSSVEEIRTKVPEMMGITAAQFRQIVMLPQGEFSRLLKASADERVELLKSIFRMDLYQKLRDKMTGKLRKIREMRESLVTRIGSEKEHIDPGEQLRLAEALKEGQDTDYLLTLLSEAETADWERADDLGRFGDQLQEKLDVLEQTMAKARQVNEQFERLDGYRRQRQAQKSDEAQMAERKVRLSRGESALRVRPLKEQWDETEKRLTRVQEEKGQLIQQKDALEREKTYLEKEGARVSSEDYEEALKQLSVLTEVRKDLVEQVVRFSEKQKLLNRQGEAVEKKEKEHRQIQQAAEQLSACETACQENEKRAQQLKSLEESLGYQIKDIQGQLGWLEEIENHFKAIEACERQIVTLRTRWKQAKNESLQKKKRLDEAGQQYRAQLAYTLGENLEEGVPCPVCGSIHHPVTLSMPEKRISDEVLAALEEDHRQALRQQDELEVKGKKEAETKQERLKNLEGYFERIQRRFENLEAVKDQQKALSVQLEDLEGRQAENQKQKHALAEKEKKDLKLRSELERKTRDLSEREQALDDARGRLQQLQGQTEALKIQLEEQLKKAEMSEDPLDASLPERIRKAAEESGRTLLEKTEEKERTLKALQQVREKAVVLESTLKLREADLEDLKTATVVQQKAFEEALIHEGLSKEDYAKQGKSTREMLDQEAAALKEYDFEVRETKGRIAELESVLKDQEPVDMEVHETEKRTFRKQQEEIRKERETVLRRVESNHRQARKLETLSEDLKDIEEKMGVCVRLDETLKGTVKGHAKISFERYILSAYLQDILESANVFLEEMSSGRYRLEVMTDCQTGRGLEIEVVDAYTGFRRSANTLSGGETFMAALSMALGLSDSVQSAAGGISLDTIFIDEGFATLDPEALDKAINCLLTIKDDGRMVGLISHVEELKERIDTKIMVEKTESGSHIMV